MAFELKQSLRLSQQLVMTPQLQQAIKLLQLNRMELVEMINQELVENPVLEEISESIDVDPQSGESSVDDHAGESDPEAEQHRDELASEQSQETLSLDSAAGTTEGEAAPELSATRDEMDWESYLEGSQAPGSTTASMREALEDLPSFENALTRSTTLEEHLRWQLSMVNLTQQEQQLATLIIGNLNEDGYFTAALEDLSREVSMELEDAEEVLKILQGFDPVGVAARSLKECLYAQAVVLQPRVPDLERLIQDFLPEVEKRGYQNIAKQMGITLDQVGGLTKLIALMEPKPGRSFHTGDTQYITPDIYIVKVGSEYVISLNDDGLPRLKISPYYHALLKREPKGQEPTASTTSKETREYVSDKLRAALWLIRSIQNRQRTIFKVTEAIVQRQKDFFEKGVQHLKPMILRDVANDIGMHESTVSRVTTNKYVHTPIGIFELKYFFNSSISATGGGDALASEAVKDKIRLLIGKEDPKKPLSDQDLAEILKKDGIDIARRTVAKYRDILGILSSSKRRNVF